MPGVTYPKPNPRVLRSHDLRGQEELPDNREWVNTADAAQMLHVSPSALRIRLNKLKCPSIRAQGGLWWKRSTVAALAESRDFLAELPEGWMEENAAIALLDCGRSSFWRWRTRGRFRTRKVLFNDRERHLYLRADVQKLRDLLTAREDIERQLNTNPTDS